MFFKMTINKAPESLTALLPQKTSERTEYNVRSMGNLTIPKARTTSFKDSFIPATTRDWNNLPTASRACKTIENFNDYLPKPEQTPAYYNSGSRKGQILHTCLRLHCSNLNSHLADRGVRDDRACHCGFQVESYKHFLLECSQYDEERDDLLDALQFQNICIKSLIYENEDLTLKDNQKIFRAVQKYIIHTKRFD